ncbi:hybrid sensor histidine kinase/response regulator [Pseudomonas putida]|uniref:histidine kinase n=1 Tax=Pseudomonas putida TaxID=303 RepID=A0AA37RGD9_PSEPU|nr:ATP-binding protein [Pseudomonas putida]GLO15083.1 hybrid sensor histidine kinase/response regulator [Pseudomonas putida]GLO37406.1 hybrid sensor histidine kinase/response regulator [Pseudomonas putida]HDS0964502.1 PAS domain-containing protein [Pseudomonas putida]HDS0990572.1 PAS domain-containing protein [Pseudomonas putida]HDS0993897.1 PAS domain-containing protein [Pseudomonas putida]
MVANSTPREPSQPVILQSPVSQSVELMGARIARFDWGCTSLGPLPRWPASLRIAVDMMHLSPFPCAVVWGADLCVVHNDGYQALRGPDALGKAFDALWSDLWPAMGPWVFKVLEGRSSFVEDPPLRIVCGEGVQALWCASGYAPLHDELGNVAGFLHTVIETTASVEAHRHWREQALGFERQIERHVAEREQFWQLSREAMMTVTPELKLHAVNPAWYRILGWTQEQVQDMPVLELVHPADRAEVQVAVSGLLQDSNTEQIETRLRHRDGHYHWFRWSARFDGSLLTAVGRDITADREEAARQSKALMRNSERMQVVGQLAGGMGHEMNNLLSGVGGSLELLQRRLQEGRLERVEAYMEVARDSVQRAMELTHRLLALSRHQPLATRPLDLNRQLRLCEPLLLKTLGAEIGLHWQLDVVPWAVNLDVRALENALINLCTNAREASLTQGSVTLRTVNKRLTAAFPDAGGLPPGDYVALYVEDDGHGMSAADIARAFEPFFTTKPIGGGAGLGLSMVYGFVSQSGGYVWIESGPEQGTKVSMLFPRCHDLVPEEPKPAPPSQRMARGERLLLVDDEVNLRAVMHEYLVERGFDVTPAGDANTALERFRHDGPFDLVITDIGLPGGFSGRQVARAMRMQLAQQKILFITGYADQSIEAQLLDQPGTALMNKPFLLADLADKALRLLDA